MTVKIMKFGGSSFRDADCYRSVAAHIASRLANDSDQAVVIVSAMYGVTESLKRLALSVNEQCDGAASAAVLTTGEIVSVGLLETALERHSVPVSSLFGYSLGIQTSAGFNRACIENINKTPLLNALRVSRVVILAGAQGADKSGRMSMLGRNSSDLTAVVAADIVGSRTCEIYSDVCGVYTCDPHLVKGARLIREISYASVSRMARFGAKVLHHGAVEYASTRDIVISCKSLVPREIVGTVVSGVGDAAIVVINTSARKVKFAGSSEQQVALALLDELDITWVKVTQDEGFDVYLSHDADCAIKKFAIAGIKLLDVSQMVLVTQVDQGRQTVYELKDIESAVSCAQRLHAALYPQEELPAVRP
ncbi:uridylate kinase [Bradyrhizobium sp. RT11b]|uniref:amino acid kinase family protein n=1 Tax=Bradyrhizobium sp. RT11b TaxID=3156332 RepID=UPI0033925808